MLAGSAAYGVGEAFHWRASLERKPRDAKKFYSVLCAVTLAGILLTFVHLNPIKALFWAAIVNGMVAGPLMVVIMLMTSNPKLMGKFTLSWGLKQFWWIATVTVFVASIGLLTT